MKKLSNKLFAAVISLGTCATPVFAGEEQTLKVSFIFPQSHWLWGQGGEVFADKVTQATEGQITFTPFPAGQLGKQTAGSVRSGIADMGIAVPSYEADKFPLTSVGELPGMHGSACEGTAKLWNLMKEGGVLHERELKPMGLRALYVDILPPYRVFSTTKQITKLEDLAGFKLRANGVAMDKTARALESVPVNVPSTELFDSLSRGTVDGSLFPTLAVKTDNLSGVLNYGVVGPKLGGGSTVMVIREDRWQKLDAATQAAFLQAGQETQQELCTWLDEAERTVEEELTALGAVAFTALPDDETARWNTAVNAVIEQWQDEMSKAGLNGQEIVGAYRDASGSF